MLRIFLSVLALVFSVSAQAEDKKDTGKYQCPAEKDKIVSDLMKEVECSHDEECGWFDYGYPWQPDACTKAIVNTGKENHNIAMLRLIEEYNVKCIYENAEERKKYDEFTANVESSKCDIPRAYCYKGFCRIQGYATFNDK